MKKYLKIFLIAFSILTLVSCTTFRARVGELKDAEIEILNEVV